MRKSVGLIATSLLAVPLVWASPSLAATSEASMATTTRCNSSSPDVYGVTLITCVEQRTGEYRIHTSAYHTGQQSGTVHVYAGQYANNSANKVCPEAYLAPYDSYDCWGSWKSSAGVTFVNSRLNAIVGSTWKSTYDEAVFLN
ncbi:hypothetical protein [Streptomyces sp. NPDC057675]|uniref:hypothetical protein n=1 Tax=Streptomyces sp. NPDC057675 TaxID=3346204 RepID=UPI00367DA360